VGFLRVEPFVPRALSDEHFGRCYPPFSPPAPIKSEGSEMERKRARDASSAVVDFDPKMLLEAQHKALYEAVTRYKQKVHLLESEVEATAASKTALQDVVSLLGRQIEAVSAFSLHTSALSFLGCPPLLGALTINLPTKPYLFLFFFSFHTVDPGISCPICPPPPFCHTRPPTYPPPPA